MTLALLLSLIAGSASRVVATGQRQAEQRSVRLSFNNRLLLNRAALNHLERIQVMLVARPDAFGPVLSVVAGLGGQVLYTDPLVGYARVEIALGRFDDLARAPEVAALQVATMATGMWYRDAAPEGNAVMFSDQERIVGAPPIPRVEDPGLPLLPAQEAHRSEYRADEDAGVGEWLARHPPFDGRGVTIAILETGRVDYAHPAFGPARTLGGTEVPKIAGVFNPASPGIDERSRVALDRAFETSHAWVRLDGRTYSVPHPGSYRLGIYRQPAAVSVVHEFPILEDVDSGEIYVDTDGDADFRDERPAADINDRLDVKELQITYPSPGRLRVVIARGSVPHTVDVYGNTYDHTTMTASVAAGSRSKDNLAWGVAPGARILLVPVLNVAPANTLVTVIETYLETMRRPDVDVLTDSLALRLTPGTRADFVSLVFQRMIDAYDKPVFTGAGNLFHVLGSAASSGAVFSVGGSMSPATFERFFAGGDLGHMIVHPVSAAGPSMDGAVRPDFVAPVHILAADAPHAAASPVLVPRNDPKWRLPDRYQIACCTSSSSPYATGVVALLISAAKQAHVPYSVAALGRALRTTAHFLPDAQAYEQGSGLIDVNAAWEALQDTKDVPTIRVASQVRHVLAAYAAKGTEGVGIFEREGWHAGMHGTRIVRFTRESGAAEPVRYRVSWTGNDGTFTSPASVVLPLGEEVELPVDIDVDSAGGHSALLNLHDPDTDVIVRRMQATVIASERFDPETRQLTMTGELPLMRTRTHYLDVPPGTDALEFEVTVRHGSLAVNLLRADGLYPEYYRHVHPFPDLVYPPGTHHVMVPHPQAGVWAVSLRNDSAWLSYDLDVSATETAEYTVSARLFDVNLAITKPGGISMVSVKNNGSLVEDPGVRVSRGTMHTATGELLASGMPNLFDVDVPEGADALVLRAKVADDIPALALHLYDCTTGECFSWDFTLPAARERTMTVRHPKPGRWVAAVTAGPLLGAPGHFSLEWLTTGKAEDVPTSASHETLAPGAALSVRLPPEILHEGAGDAYLVELIDKAAEQRALKYPWRDPERTYVTLRQIDATPVAVGLAFWQPGKMPD